jgi:signal transduction histidine kinase
VGSRSTVTAGVRPGEALFCVKDEGPGMPEEARAHAFDRYWQLRDSDRRGSGLGLYIAKGIVDAHGGRIWIDSTPGQGTAVYFTLLGRSVAAMCTSRPPLNVSLNGS